MHWVVLATRLYTKFLPINVHYNFVNIWPPLSRAPRDLRSLILQIISYLMRYLVRQRKSKIYFAGKSVDGCSSYNNLHIISCCRWPRFELPAWTLRAASISEIDMLAPIPLKNCWRKGGCFHRSFCVTRLWNPNDLMFEHTRGTYLTKLKISAHRYSFRAILRWE